MIAQIIIAIIGILHILNTSIIETYVDSENRVLVREVSTPLVRIANSLSSINKKLDFLVGYKSLEDEGEDSEDKDEKPTPGQMNRANYPDYVSG
jgi:hypothetical protein